MRSSFLILSLLSAFLGAQAPPFDRAHAEHLLNRAGFGGPPEEIDRLARMGREAAVRLLVDGAPGQADELPFLGDPIDAPARGSLRALGEEERRRALARLRQEHRARLEACSAWWLERMVATAHPLRERMVLFWHGYFTSSFRDVRNANHLIVQNELFRTHALGSFRLLLHEIARDPAMLEYLDNRQNRKQSPNENFAREVMELFTLGVGNYTERDIKEAARAFTGWTFVNDRFVFLRRAHDEGSKTILGRTGNLDGTDVLDLLLEQKAASKWVAGRLLASFVGTDVPDRMVDRYAALLRKHEWELRPFFLTLFNDPDFYRPEVVGSHILSPVEFVVGISRRLGETPPGPLLARSASLLGQTVFDPPNVKGWEGGEAWITTSTFLQRGNFAGYLVEGLTARRLREDFAAETGGSMGMAQMGRAFRGLGARGGWVPKTRLTPIVEAAGAASLESCVDVLCDRFLGVPVTEEARASLLGFLREGSDEAAPFVLPSEFRLRRLLRILLSLPEAQLG